MNICIESQALNHHWRSGLMTYTEGLINGINRVNQKNQFHLVYYSLTRSGDTMPGPQNGSFKKIVLKIPDQMFLGRQTIIDRLALPAFFKAKGTKIFHRPAGYTMPRVKNVLNVLTVHDLRTLTIGDKTCEQDIGQYQRTLQSVDICMTVSECTKRDIMNHFQMPEKKIKVVYLAADERFRPAEPARVEELRKKYQLNEPYLLSVGSVPRKNIEGIVRAFAKTRAHKQFILVVCCNWDFEKYQVIARELRIEDRVRFLNKLEDSEVVTMYSGCHSFVFPSLYEGFGLPILEAMQCGAPVITSNMSSCPEVAGDAAILVNPQSHDEITAAIDQICSDDRLRKGLIEKGFQRAKMFSWEKLGREMQAIYDMA